MKAIKKISEWEMKGEPLSKKQIENATKSENNKYYDKNAFVIREENPTPEEVEEYEIKYDRLYLYKNGKVVDEIMIEHLVRWFITKSPYFKLI